MQNQLFIFISSVIFSLDNQAQAQCLITIDDEAWGLVKEKKLLSAST